MPWRHSRIADRTMFRLALILRILVMPLVIGAIVFVSGGRVDLPFVWIVLAEFLTFFLVTAIVADEGLIRERQAPGGENRDRLTLPLSIVFLLAHWMIAGLDVRYGWSPVPMSMQVAGVIGYGAALVMSFWAMRVNRFFSSVVRVQADRGQQVVDGGPYGVVRHPGYAAALVAMFCGGIALGSWLAMIPVAGFALLFLRRTWFEDNLLRRELPGYEDYARRVRYRLLPGVF
jgi:protein-S-isoprenylcysteine O-methyltransferase Ste14